MTGEDGAEAFESGFADMAGVVEPLWWTEPTPMIPEEDEGDGPFWTFMFIRWLARL